LIYRLKSLHKITHSQIPSDLFVQRDAAEFWIWVKSDAFKTKANMAEAEKAFKEKEAAIFTIEKSAIIRIEKIIIVKKRETIWEAKPTASPRFDSPLPSLAETVLDPLLSQGPEDFLQNICGLAGRILADSLLFIGDLDE
jgi:hypothetical protein